MRGHSLARIIGSRIKYLKDKNREYDLAGTIRSVMDDVEQIARFTAPRYLSCYIDLLRLHLEQQGRSDLASQMPDVNLWLEFGASQQTQLSMMGLGLSRTSAIALSEFIVDDKLSETAVIEKIAELKLDSLGIPLAIVREIKALLRPRKADSELDEAGVDQGKS